MANLTQIKCDLLVVNEFEGIKTPGGGTGAVNRALDGLIQKIQQDEKFKAEFGKFLVFHTHGKIPAKKVMVLGLGKRSEFDIDKIRKLGAITARKAGDMGAKRVVSILHGAGIAGLDPAECAQALAEGAALANYKFLKYKNKEAKKLAKTDIKEFIIAEVDDKKIKKIEKGIELGKIFSMAQNYARDLVNEPGLHMLPKDLARVAQETAAANKNTSVKIYSKQELEKMGAQALLGVAAGSAHEPCLIHLKYKPKQGSIKKKIVLVGKGLTFDSGGLNIKHDESMSFMKIDMAGAAAVLGVFSALDKLNSKYEVHGIIGACENMPSGSAIRPGDVLTSMSGKTIEVANTDAEGRVTLADTLVYARRLKPDAIIDIATLTGAVIVSLGGSITGLFANNQALGEKLKKSAQATGENLWQLPLEKDYKKLIESTVADVKNTGGRAGGAIMAALFLQEFVGQIPWAHLDIAGTCYAEKDINEYTPAGGTGVGVRLLLDYLIK
ncbi:leucyl aminopeptidase [Patescibacteria group bacterium]|nr:leucyl aminopeptidase [Patescibacteria group bacterium]